MENYPKSRKFPFIVKKNALLVVSAVGFFIFAQNKVPFQYLLQKQNQTPIINRFLKISSKESVSSNLASNPSEKLPVLQGFPAQQRLDSSNLVVYQVWLNYYAQNFTNGQTSPNVFVNAAAHLPEMCDMGVTMIQLSPFHPFLKQTTIGSPYGSLDYYDVNAGYAPGDKNARILALKNYILEAHKNNIKVIMDCVYHSTDQKNILVTSHPEYYQHDLFGHIKKNHYGFYILDYNNPDLRTYMINMVKYWENTIDIDGCRADIAVDVPLSFWAILNNELKKMKPNWFMVAETSSQLKTYGGTYSGPGYNGEKYDKIYGFDALYGVNSMLATRAILNNQADQYGGAMAISQVWQYPEIYPGGNKTQIPQETVFYRGEDNHDQHPRTTTLAAGNPGMLAGMVVNFTLDGIPFIFNGQEIGDIAPTSIRMQQFISWNNPLNPENRQIFKQLLSLRKNHPALNKGTTVWYTSGNPAQVISYVKQNGTEKILVVVNLSSNRWSGVINGVSNHQLIGKATNLLTNQPLPSQPKNNTINLSLSSYGFLVASLE